VLRTSSFDTYFPRLMRWRISAFNSTQVKTGAASELQSSAGHASNGKAIKIPA
jgi:hypothetical protein